MHRIGPSSLRLALGVLLAGSVLGQLLLPVAAEALGGGHRETQHLVGPYAAMGIVAVLGFQIAIGAVWWLLHRAHRGRLHTRGALRGLHVLSVGVLAATVVPLLTMLHLLLMVGVGGPGTVLGAAACLATAVAATLLLRSAGRTLRAATAHRSDPAAVTEGSTRL